MKRLAPFAFLLVLVGCSAWLVPETPRERLVAAEADYEAAVTTIGDLADQGLVKGKAALAAGTAVQSARASLNLWHDLPDDPDLMDAGISGLTQLQALVRSLKKKEPPS